MAGKIIVFEKVKGAVVAPAWKWKFIDGSRILFESYDSFPSADAARENISLVKRLFNKFTKVEVER